MDGVMDGSRLFTRRLNGAAARLRLAGGALMAVTGLLVLAAPAAAKGETVLQAAAYAGMTTYDCATDPITIHRGRTSTSTG
jgi:hypothetical protein